jgi:two-component system, NarL family, invasion response regulator UvrY
MNLLIVDDHDVVRTGIRSVLQDIFNQATIYEAYDEKSALVLVKERNYDLIIMDVQMPNTDSFGFLEYIKMRDASAKVLVFSMSNENIYAKRFLKSGAMGYVSKSTGLTELTKAVDLVMSGRKYISENLSELFAQEFDIDATPNRFDQLSKREFEVAALLMKNKSINEVASILSINSSTVASHKARVLEKMGVKNIIELIEMDAVNKKSEE